jgi:hypothetical protein
MSGNHSEMSHSVLSNPENGNSLMLWRITVKISNCIAAAVYQFDGLFVRTGKSSFT